MSSAAAAPGPVLGEAEEQRERMRQRAEKHDHAQQIDPDHVIRDDDRQVLIEPGHRWTRDGLRETARRLRAKP